MFSVLIFKENTHTAHCCLYEHVVTCSNHCYAVLASVVRVLVRSRPGKLAPEQTTCVRGQVPGHHDKGPMETAHDPHFWRPWANTQKTSTVDAKSNQQWSEHSCLDTCVGMEQHLQRVAAVCHSCS